MFVIISQDGKPLTDVKGRVIKTATEAEAARWVMPGERIEPYEPVKHPPGEPRGTAGE